MGIAIARSSKRIPVANYRGYFCSIANVYDSELKLQNLMHEVEKAFNSNCTV